MTTRPATRGLAVLLLGVALLLGITLPARAALSDQVATSVSVTTATVAAPATVSTAGSTCGSTFTVRLSWAASTTDRVTGYVVTVYRGDGTSGVVTTTGSRTTAFTGTYARGYQNYSFTVTARTAYGWTAESARTAPLYC
jgi:hypothetical protein